MNYFSDKFLHNFCLFSTLHLYLFCVRMYLRYLLIIIQIVVRNAMWSIYMQELEANEICYYLFEFLPFKWNENFLNHSRHECVCVRVKERLNREHWTQRSTRNFRIFLGKLKEKKTAATPKITTTKVRIALLAGFVYIYLALLSFGSLSLSIIWNVRRDQEHEKGIRFDFIV